VSARRPVGTPSRERGIALLTAILLVALGTIIAASLGYKTVLTARRGAGVFAFDESLLAAESAEALAGYALTLSRQQNSQYDAPGQLWSMPYGPVQVAPGVTVTASLQDLQGRFNLNNLVKPDGTIDDSELQAFQNLLGIVGLDPKWAAMMADWIDADSVPYPTGGAEDPTYLSQVPPYRTANRWITSASELLALPGFGAERYEKLAPYVTALPPGPVNLCTASGPVLDALGPPGLRQYSEMSAQQLAEQRAAGCFPTRAEYQEGFNEQAGNVSTVAMAPGGVAEQSSYFLLTSIVDVGSDEFYLYSLLARQGTGQPRVIQRSFTPD
jgi:general secretion pathway protein K